MVGQNVRAYQEDKLRRGESSCPNVTIVKTTETSSSCTKEQRYPWIPPSWSSFQVEHVTLLRRHENGIFLRFSRSDTFLPTKRSKASTRGKRKGGTGSSQHGKGALLVVVCVMSSSSAAVCARVWFRLRSKAKF